MDIVILFGLIILNGFFAMSEMALVTARKARLQASAQQGDEGAAIAIRLGSDPTFFMSAVQIGITSIGVLNGIVGESALSPPFSAWLQNLGIEASVANPLATALVVITITYFSIVIGELVPKRLGQIYPEAIAKVVAKPMLWLSIIAHPFVLLLSASTRFVLKLLGVDSDKTNNVTQEDIDLLLDEGSDAGVIEAHEHQMVRNVFSLDDRQIASLMVPRNDIVFIDADKPLDENLKNMEEHRYSRYPVLKGGWRHILGVANASHLLNQVLRGEKPSFTEELKPAVFVPESLTGMELLENFKSSDGQMVFVIDEYGEIQGIITLHDMMEAITGEFKPLHIEDAWAVQREDGSWLIDGLTPILELKRILGISYVPEEEKGRYHTLSGMLMLLLGRLPNTADVCDWDKWRLEVVDMDGTRIDKVLATPVNAEALKDIN